MANDNGDSVNTQKVRSVVAGEIGAVVTRIISSVGIPAMLAILGWLAMMIMDGHDKLIKLESEMMDTARSIQFQLGDQKTELGDHESRIRDLSSRMDRVETVKH